MVVVVVELVANKAVIGVESDSLRTHTVWALA